MKRSKSIIAFSLCCSLFYCSSVCCNQEATAAELERLNLVYSTIASASLPEGAKNED